MAVYFLCITKTGLTQKEKWWWVVRFVQCDLHPWCKRYIPFNSVLQHSAVEHICPDRFCCLAVPSIQRRLVVLKLRACGGRCSGGTIACADVGVCCCCGGGGGVCGSVWPDGNEECVVVRCIAPIYLQRSKCHHLQTTSGFNIIGADRCYPKISAKHPCLHLRKRKVVETEKRRAVKHCATTLYASPLAVTAVEAAVGGLHRRNPAVCASSAASSVTAAIKPAASYTGVGDQPSARV